MKCRGRKFFARPEHELSQPCGRDLRTARSYLALAFGCTYEQQEAAIARLLYFVEKFWAELLRFSRRTQSQMNRWAARYGIRLTRPNR